MEITSGRYFYDQGIMPSMELIIDDYPVLFGHSIKRSILENAGAVYLFGYPEEKLPVIKLNPPFYGDVTGFTTDPTVIAWVQHWFKIMDGLIPFTAGEIDVSTPPTP